MQWSAAFEVQHKAEAEQSKQLIKLHAEAGPPAEADAGRVTGAGQVAQRPPTKSKRPRRRSMGDIPMGNEDGNFGRWGRSPLAPRGALACTRALAFWRTSSAVAGDETRHTHVDTYTRTHAHAHARTRAYADGARLSSPQPAKRRSPQNAAVAAVLGTGGPCQAASGNSRPIGGEAARLWRRWQAATTMDNRAAPPRRRPSRRGSVRECFSPLALARVGGMHPSHDGVPPPPPPTPHTPPTPILSWRTGSRRRWTAASGCSGACTTSPNSRKRFRRRSTPHDTFACLEQNMPC